MVDRVIFANEENGYHVIELLCGDESFVITGSIPFIYEGEYMSAVGHFVMHPTYGRQFEVESAKRFLPQSKENILRYLTSGAVKGIGQVTAERIYEKFGDNTLSLLEADPMVIGEIRGISRTKALSMAEQLTKLFDLRRNLTYLYDFGLQPSESFRAIKVLGDTAISLVDENPYVLCDPGIEVDFEKIDSIAFERGIEYNSDRRLRAGVAHVLRHNLLNGHTCLPTEKLLAAAQTLLRCEPELAENALQSMFDSGDIIPIIFGERQYCFLSEIYEAERYIAGRIESLAKSRKFSRGVTDEEIKKIETKYGIVYETYQKDAIRTAVSNAVSVITGGPGTGKTTILRAVLGLLHDRDLSVFLAAPTGRAAKRMSELVGWEATTIHRLLEAGHTDGVGVCFGKNEASPLECDVVIIDEASMCDIYILDGLLRAMKPETGLILVGDADQLPAVGPGNIMRDLVASGKLPLICLTEIYRQAANSLIVVNAHCINRGEYPELDRRDNDFFFLNAASEAACSQLVCSLAAKRLPKSTGWSPFTEIQVLTPGKKGPLGTFELNKKLQQILNPQKGPDQLDLNGSVFRTGDKIMQIHNDYDIMWTRGDAAGTGLFNGDCGIITAVDRQSRLIYADFDGRSVCFAEEQLRNIELAYAITVHKSQGSEYEAVIIPAFPSFSPKLLFRNLLYTAVTRARSMLIIVGQRETVASMVDNDRKSLRYTGLKKFLTAGPDEL